jgi:hypothetical protein
MWQVYAIVAHDLLEDRRRTEESRRQHVPAKKRRSPAALVKRIVTGRDGD